MIDAERFNFILKAFKVRARCVRFEQKENISLFDIEPEIGSKISDITKFSNDFSFSLKSKFKPLFKSIPELGIVRMEIVNKGFDKIDLFSNFPEKLLNKKIPVFLGKSFDGNNIYMDISENPHMLVAGATGSGKSTLLHTIMANLLKLNCFIKVIDTKNVEFEEYKYINNNVEIINSYDGSINLLNSLEYEMNYRYSLLRDARKNNKDLKLNPIILLIDEFADLIMQDNKKQLEKSLTKLVQKSRAADIYCVLATQRPSSDILKGSIKANFPARIACKVASKTDSRVILDANGAESLAGNGDAILLNNNYSYQRFQVAYTNAQEVSSVLKK